MTHPTSIAILEFATAATVGGALLGLVYFACLRWTTELLATDGGWARPAVLTFVRFAAVTAAFGLAARWGAVPLLAGFAGFLVSRGIALRQARSAA